MKRYWFGLLSLVLFVIPLAAAAQFAGLSTGASITATPQFPEPNTPVTVRINDFSLGGNTVQIDWYLNGSIQESFASQREITFTAGALGTETVIEAVLVTDNQQTVNLRTSVTPSRVALIVEPFTSAPTWYEGKPLPSVGSNIRVVAIPQTADNLPPEAYTYTWRFDNAVVNAGAARGGYQRVFTMPFGRGANMSVEVTNPEGVVVGNHSVFVPNVEPEVYFYELSPLRGMSRLTVPDTITLLGEEMTVRAEPYHISKNTASQDISYEWDVDGRSIENPNADQQTLTLRNGGGFGRFNVEFHIRSLVDLLQGAKNDFTVTF